MNIISGEQFQKIADIYIGKDNEDFLFNPAIGISNKNLCIKDIPNEYDNPNIIYCYGFRLLELYNKLDNFKNNFILISGNADTNIDESFIKIADHPKIIKWYSQNVSLKHKKLHFIPIGIANKQWKHGNIDEFKNIININFLKPNFIYFNFNINTNISKRLECYNVFKNYIHFLPEIEAINNIYRLASYKFCICPEGNGLDTHRLWECWYLKVVPIVLKNTFIEILMEKINLPIIIIKKWEDLLTISLDYNNYNFNYCKYLDFDYYQKEINNIKHF